MVREPAGRNAPVLLLTALLVAGLFAVAPADANPAVPYCGPASLGGATSQTGDLVMPEVCEQITGRVFPEAFAHEEYGPDTVPATDFIGFFEFQAGLEYLAAQYPDYLTVHEVGTSVGLDGGSGQDQFPVYMLEITNLQSPMPMEERQSVLFMLSIHGNEKGGREGGFRVLEDLVKGIGIGAETVQGGAGLPEPIAKPTGGEVQTYQDYLDFMRVFLLFPNPDGWAHDEVPYVATEAGLCGTLFCRTNGNGVDLNRQAPTLGWQDPNRNVVGEPEAVGYYNWMLTNDIDWSYGIDIHGMLMHRNFAAIMLPAASMTPQEMQRSLRLAETLKERLNGNDHFAAWQTLFETGEQAEDLTAPVREAACLPEDPTGQIPAVPFGECPLAGSALDTVGSSTFAEYYTVIDAIGYTDSGFNGDYFAQDTGLNAPGYDIELAYNHIAVDSQYEGLGAFLNDYHVTTVREIVKSFMDAAALDVQISFETGGLRTLYLEPPFVATNLDDEAATPGGWADENAGDDLWDYGPDQAFFARPAKYWEDLRPFLRDGDQPGVLVKTTADKITRTALDRYDTLVIPGSAIKEIEDDASALATILAWVEGGGDLVLTDEALRFFDLSGLTTGAVDVSHEYMGGIKVDLSHPMLEKVRGGVMQMYEPTPIGFEVGANAAPNWFVAADAVTGLGGEIAGRACGSTSLNDPACDDNGAGLGFVPLGQGRIQFMGSLLPDPTEEFYHPYGLDHYATTYSGNQILRNMLGWDEVFSDAPVVISDSGQIVQSRNEPEPVAVGGDAGGDEGSNQTPGVGPLALLALAGAAAVVSRRRRA